MRRMFQAFLVLFGVVVVAISIAHLAIGPEAIIGGSDANATSNGEDRFFAGVFLGYGLAVLWCARDVQRKRRLVTFLAAVMFVGGIGRFLAMLTAGAPNPFYDAMLAVELVLPVLLVLTARKVEVSA
jgi:Domain of unknown function (DUF4345)